MVFAWRYGSQCALAASYSAMQGNDMMLFFPLIEAPCIIYLPAYFCCIDRTSASVSRGLQVEEDDLIQFTNGFKASLANGNVSGGASAALSTSTSVAQLKKQLRSRLSLDDEDLEDEDEEEEDGEIDSARSAEEHMDYLESLEPCPCYAKCCLDSLISLFCVTVLG